MNGKKKNSPQPVVVVVCVVDEGVGADKKPRNATGAAKAAEVCTDPFCM